MSRLTDVVPDIYAAAHQREGWIELTTDLQVGERVRLIGERESGVWTVAEVREGAFRAVSPLPDGRVFVYGREVKDFRTVDYEAISMLHVSATQELARRLQTELSRARAEREALQARVAQLERLLLPQVAKRKPGR